MHMCNAHGNVIHTKCCSQDQKPEHVGQCNQRTQCQQHFTQTYKTNYKYTVAIFQQGETKSLC